MEPKQTSPRDRLFRDLISDYHASLDPGKTELTYGLIPLHVHYDKPSGELLIGAWEYHLWKDARLAWSASSHHGIKSLRIPAKQIWIPDTKLHNSLTAIVERDSNINALVNSDGSVLWMPRVNYRVMGQERANGEIHGKVKIGCWTYNEVDVALRMYTRDGFDLKHLEPTSKYIITSSAAKLTTIEFENEPYPFMEVDFVATARGGI